MNIKSLHPRNVEGTSSSSFPQGQIASATVESNKTTLLAKKWQQFDVFQCVSLYHIISLLFITCLSNNWQKRIISYNPTPTPSPKTRPQRGANPINKHGPNTEPGTMLCLAATPRSPNWSFWRQKTQSSGENVGVQFFSAQNCWISCRDFSLKHP